MESKVQILVKLPDQTTVAYNDVQLSTTTIADVKRFGLSKMNSPLPLTRVKVTIPGIYQALEDDRPLAEYQVKKGDTIRLDILQAPVAYDLAVKKILHDDLQRLASEPGPYFVFSGIGSENASNTAMVQQQCPAGLIHYCDTHKLSLRILLIDEGFKGTTHTQIYNTADTNWVQPPYETLASGKVRRYRYKDALHELWVYCTQVLPDEYNAIQHTLADLEMPDFAKVIAQKKGQVLIGNFYKVTNPPLCATIDFSEIQKQ